MADFSQQFEIIYKTYAKQAIDANLPCSKLAFARFLGISQGRLQKWESGQVPRADDLQMLNERMGFSYRWMITGVGNPFEEEVESLKAKLADTEAELREVRREKQTLTTQLLIDGVGDQAAVTNTGKVGEGHE